MKLFTICLSFLSLSVTAQVNTPTWGVEDTILVITKTTDFGPVHDYIELYNNSGQDLQMRWVCREPSSWPVLWETDFSDPSNAYYDVTNLDSADFVITDPIEWGNKLIIGVQHMSYAWSDTVSFKVWPIDFPEDSLRLYYVIQIAQGGAWASIDDSELDANFLFDEQEKLLRLKVDSPELTISILNMSGQIVFSQNEYNGNSSNPIDLSALRAGMYVIRVSDGLRSSSLKLSLN